MFAVFKTGGKQYCAAPGKAFVVEKSFSSEEGQHDFKDVLMVHAEGGIECGAPFVEKALVRVKVCGAVRGKKVLVFKKKRRNNYRRLNGHRQPGILVRVEDILVGGKSVLPKVDAKALANKAAGEGVLKKEPSATQAAGKKASVKQNAGVAASELKKSAGADSAGDKTAVRASEPVKEVSASANKASEKVSEEKASKERASKEPLAEKNTKASLAKDAKDAPSASSGGADALKKKVVKEGQAKGGKVESSQGLKEKD